jgi:hypothetical protein
MIIDLLFSTFATQRDLRWVLPLVVLGNVVVATIAWTIVWLVMK